MSQKVVNRRELKNILKTESFAVHYWAGTWL